MINALSMYTLASMNKEFYFLCMPYPWCIENYPKVTISPDYVQLSANLNVENNEVKKN